ncbi:RNA pseudouridine synthase superfamily protein [Besnoitia besnoiti]|uniref:RNA pseudouridine synthase superfamily protein n=1 Tax=Besnoitia besnoiti TaxID=94643 RepID=A0A2A9MAB6_BESBE|nr:RNA pseudouridine synthase superfamily protein [Besnoitia besnoiti]PFH32557.1 RNA pseudouridine synthase superfamily protein [Besnoitia besnoiti]
MDAQNETRSRVPNRAAALSAAMAGDAPAYPLSGGEAGDVTTSAPRFPVPDDFKVVADPVYRAVKVVPPYWHTFETDVKMRWRDRSIFEVVTSEFRSRPTSYYQHAIDSGKFILVNQRACTRDTVLRNGDHLTHRTLEIEFAIPAATPVRILYEDEELLAVFKPAGIPVHPQGRYTQASLTGILKRFHLRQDASAYLHPINRLDRVTAGVVILAKNPTQARTLTTAIASAIKIYVARVRGNFAEIVERVRAAARACPPSAERGVSLEVTATAAACSTDADTFDERKLSRADEHRDGRGTKNNFVNGLTHENTTDSNSTGSAPTLLRETDTSPDAPSLEKDISGTAEHRKSPESAPSVTERRKRKEEKRRQKAEKKLRREEQYEQRQREHELKMSRQNAADEDFSIEEATRRGIFSVITVSAPHKRPPVSCRSAEQTTSATGDHSTVLASNDAACAEGACEGRASGSPGGCCSRTQDPSPEVQHEQTWLKVSARLVVSSCLVGRQLAVGWNEELGKEAETVFKTLHYDENSGTSLVACVPLTGRTHQIRKHLHILGASIIGDALYSSSSTSRIPESPLESSPEDIVAVTSLADSTVAKNRPPGDASALPRRASSERSVPVSFSLDELREVNRGSIDCICPQCRRLTNTNSTALDTSQVGDCRFLGALREIAGLSDVAVSPDGQTAEARYVIEEPCAIDLISFAYLFDTPSNGSGAAATDAPRGCDASEWLQPTAGDGKIETPKGLRSDCGFPEVAAAAEAAHGRRKSPGVTTCVHRTESKGLAGASPSDRTGKASTPDAAVASPCHSTRFLIACPPDIMPTWTYPAAPQELRSLFGCLRALRKFNKSSEAGASR